MSDELIEFSMSAFKKFFSIFLIIVMLLFLVLLPANIGELLSSKRTIDWLMPKKEPYCGVISVWHISEFRPYVGSIGAWLKKHAKTIEKRHFGVYLEIEAMGVEEANKRLERGEFPDAISFAPGRVSELRLTELTVDTSELIGFDGGEANTRAVPFAASCELLLYYAEGNEDADIERLKDKAADKPYSDFKAAKADCCIADAGAAGEMQRLVASNKAAYFEAVPISAETKLVQFIGMSASLEEEKRGYIEEFISLIISNKAQAELVELGLMPLNADVALSCEQRFLAEAYGKIRESGGVLISPFQSSPIGGQ